MLIIAIDLGGTTIKLGFIHEGELIDAMHIPAEAGGKLKENLERANSGMHNLLDHNQKQRKELQGIGIAFPGIVDPFQNVVVSRYVKYKDGASFDFNRWAQDQWNLPLVLENDARAALVGEWQYGAGKGYDNIVLVTLGTGLGSAVLLEGKLLRGQNFIAGNLWGHISVNLNGQLCNCGYIGCLETEASTWVLEEKLKNYKGYENKLHYQNLQFQQVFKKAANGDKIANDLVKECLHAWGVCAVNMVHAYDPQLIIFSGGIMDQETIILPLIQKMIDRFA